MAEIISFDDLPHSEHSHEFVGADHEDAPFSLILVHVQPGHGPQVHRHPYAEVFVVESGTATFRIGSRDARGHRRPRRRQPAGRGARLHEHRRGRAATDRDPRRGPVHDRVASRRRPGLDVDTTGLSAGAGSGARLQGYGGRGHRVRRRTARGNSFLYFILRLPRSPSWKTRPMYIPQARLLRNKVHNIIK